MIGPAAFWFRRGGALPLFNGTVTELPLGVCFMAGKPSKITRKNPRRFEMVRFESDLFNGVFELPSLASFDLKAQRSLMKNDVEPMFSLLAEAGVSDDAVAAIDSLSGDEAAEFMREWGEAGTVPAGKSGA